MINAPGAQSHEPVARGDEETDAAPFFPSEGTFSAVVPLSEVRAGRDSARRSTALVAKPAEPRESEEEATLVPARGGRGRLARRAPGAGRDGRRWLAMTGAVVLSVVAGLAVGAYMVWTQQARQARPPAAQAADAPAPNADAAAASQAAPEVPLTEPAPDAAPAPEPAAEVVKVEPVVSPEASADDAKPAKPAEAAAAKPAARTPAAETAARREAETGTRAAARERARAAAAESAPAPRAAARREPAPRRQAAPERARTSATASRGRALPVSSPPPSARPRTVIQWP